MYGNGASSKIVRLIRNLPETAKVCTNRNNKQTKYISLTEGVLQGDILRPILFATYVNDIEESFRKHGARGLNVNGLIAILLLAYADDIIILCQSKLIILEEYDNGNKLSVNTNKTRILTSHKSRKKINQHPFKLNKKTLRR